MKYKIKSIIKRMLHIEYLRTMGSFHYDAKRIVAHSAPFTKKNKTTEEARIVLNYHIIEKGITMPNRHLPFGRKVAIELVKMISNFIDCYGRSNQVDHAIMVLKEYYDIHFKANVACGDEFAQIKDFLGLHVIKPSEQLQFSREDYYSCRSKPFNEFARMRHTIRSYSGCPLDMAKIKSAVKLAISAPTACNRQQIRVHCIADKVVCQKVLDIQGGNRGFGHLADKVLIITADLRGEIGGIKERYDPYINGGIFLMNLCYALTYYEVAHCILTCSLERGKDERIRLLSRIPDNEILVAMICCGEPTDNFRVALSPKRDIDEVLFTLEGK